MAEFSLKDTLIGGGLLFGIGVFLKSKKGKKKVNLDYDNWGGNPDGKLAKALAKAREESKKPREPLKIERLDAEGIREGRYGSILNFEFNEGNISWKDDVLPLVEEYTNDWNAQGIGFGEVSVSVQSPRKVVLEKLKADLDNQLGGYIYYEAEAFDSESHTDRVARLRKQIEDSQEELENIRYCNHEEWVSISNNIGGLDSNSFSLTIECENCGSHGVAEWEEPTFVSWDRTYMSETFNADDDVLRERAKIKTSLRGEIRDLQNEKMKLEEYMDYDFTPPAWWEYRTHEQKSIEPFFSSRLNRMRQFHERELDRINDINAQIEDLISYLGWIDEFYGTREE